MLGLAFGMDSGGWFLVSQRVRWRQLHADFGLDPKPIETLTRGIQKGVLRPIGSGVRFVHNDVRDFLAEVAYGAPGSSADPAHDSVDQPS